MYGGVTPQEYAVVVEMNRSGRRIVRMATGLVLDCATDRRTGCGRAAGVSKSGRFSAQFGPVTQRDTDGTAVEVESSVAGKFSKSRSSVSGTWTSRSASSTPPVP